MPPSSQELSPLVPEALGLGAEAGQPFPPATTRGHHVHTPEGTGAQEVRRVPVYRGLGMPCLSCVPPSWTRWALGPGHPPSKLLSSKGCTSLLVHWATWLALTVYMGPGVLPAQEVTMRLVPLWGCC